MQITPSNELVFNGPADQDALYEVHRLFEKNAPFGKVSFDEYVLRLQEHLQDSTGLEDYVGPVSPEELADRIAETEIDFLQENGKSSGAGKNADAGLAALMRKVAVQEQDITYVLPPKWVPVVLVGSIVLGGAFRTRRDELLQLMIDGLPEVIPGLDPQAADGMEGQGIEPEPLTPEEEHEVNTMCAQIRFDRAVHAIDILKTIAKYHGRLG